MEHGILNDECGTLLQCSVFNIPCLPAGIGRFIKKKGPLLTEPAVANL